MNEPPASGHSSLVRDSAASLALPWLTVDTAEPDLVERLRRGEIAALGEAYDEHHEHVRVFARRLLGERAAAEDLVQETFLTLLRAMPSFRAEASLRTFLLGIAANGARHHVRAAMRRRAAHARSEDGPRAAPSTPEDGVARRQLAEALTRALDTLPFDQRVAIVLCEVEDRSCAEAATIVGAPEATVRTRIFHGKRKLRDALEALGIR